MRTWYGPTSLPGIDEGGWDKSDIYLAIYLYPSI